MKYIEINQQVADATLDQLLKYVDNKDRERGNLTVQNYRDKIKKGKKRLTEKYKEILIDRLWRDLCEQALAALEEDYKKYFSRLPSQRDFFRQYLNEGRKSNSVKDCFTAIEQEITAKKSEKEREEQQEKDREAKRVLEEKTRAEENSKQQLIQGTTTTPTPKLLDQSTQVEKPGIGTEKRKNRNRTQYRLRQKREEAQRKAEEAKKNPPSDIERLSRNFEPSTSIPPDVDEKAREEIKIASGLVPKAREAKRVLKGQCDELLKSIGDLTGERETKYTSGILTMPKSKEKHSKAQAFRSEISKEIGLFIVSIESVVPGSLPNLINSFNEAIERIKGKELKEYHTTASKGFLCMKSITTNDRNYFNNIERKLDIFQNDISIRR